MKIRWLDVGVIAAMYAFAAAVYSRLPAEVPVHFELSGRANGWAPRFPGAFLCPLIATALVLMLPALIRVDPRRRNFERFGPELRLLITVLVLFMAWVEVFSLGSALGWPMDVGAASLVGLGALFAAIGNYLPRIRSNWWVGIRTPWTLENDRVWRETHRVGGRAFVAAGLAIAGSALLPDDVRVWVAGAALAAATVVPVAYSYLSWRRQGGRAA